MKTILLIANFADLPHHNRQLFEDDVSWPEVDRGSENPSNTLDLGHVEWEALSGVGVPVRVYLLYRIVSLVSLENLVRFPNLISFGSSEI